MGFIDGIKRIMCVLTQEEIKEEIEIQKLKLQLEEVKQKRRNARK